MFSITPTQLTDLALRTAQLMAESHIVITLRLMGAMGAWPVSPDEMHLMYAEKGPAFLRATARAQRAVASGSPLPVVALAVITPLTHKVRRNRRRLTRAG